MARRQGSLPLDAAVEPSFATSLDARQFVRTKEELLSEGSFEYGFNGLLVSVRDEQKVYMLIDKDNPTVEASWKEIGGSAGGGTDPVAWDDVRNKPTFATVATSGSYNDLSDQPTIPEAYDDSALDARVTALENASPAAPAWDTITGKPDFANVATSGDYNDLGNKPTIPEAYDDTEVRGLIAGKANTADLAPVATSGSYNDLGDKPTIPEAYDDAEVRGLIAAKANSADLAAVATSGSYNDLSDKPTIPAEVTVDSAMSDVSENPVQNKVVLAAIGDAIDVVETAIADRYTKAETDAKIAEAMTDVDNNHFHVVTALPDPSVAKENHEYVLVTYAQDGTTIESEVHYLFYDGVFHQRTTQISLDGYATETYVGQQLATLATVATSGSYDDLSDKPTIPEAYDDTALAGRVTAIETALNLTALTDEEIAALIPA